MSKRLQRPFAKRKKKVDSLSSEEEPEVKATPTPPPPPPKAASSPIDRTPFSIGDIVRVDSTPDHKVTLEHIRLNLTGFTL